jgi:hypothetical protein
MGLKETLSKKLTPELMDQLEEALGDDFDYDVVPRSRLNKVIKQRNELKDKLASPPQDDDDPDNGDTGKGKASKGLTEKEVQAQIDALKAEHLKDLESVKIQHAAVDKLRAANAIDPDLILKSGVIDVTKLAFDAAGALTGLDDQVTEVTKSKAYLFKAAKDGARGTGKGADGDGGGDGATALDNQLKAVFSSYGVTPAQ